MIICIFQRTQGREPRIWYKITCSGQLLFCVFFSEELSHEGRTDPRVFHSCNRNNIMRSNREEGHSLRQDLQGRRVWQWGPADQNSEAQRNYDYFYLWWMKVNFWRKSYNLVYIRLYYFDPCSQVSLKTLYVIRDCKNFIHMTYEFPATTSRRTHNIAIVVTVFVNPLLQPCSPHVIDSIE